MAGGGIGSLAQVRPTAQGEVWIADDSQVSQNLKAALSWALKEGRPVVIAQTAPNVPRNRELVLVCPLTTGSASTSFDVLVHPKETGLKEASMIQTSLLFPIPRDALKRKTGQLPAGPLERFRVRLGMIFGLVTERP